MQTHKDTSHVSWLSAALSTQKARVMGLMCRISDMGPVEAMKPSVFNKFLNMLDQVAAERCEETKILSEIEAVEQKHRFCRKEKMVRYVPTKPEALAWEQETQDKDVKAQRPFGWLFVFVVWYLFFQNRQKKQSLTAD